jgi:hypothetical protein
VLKSYPRTFLTNARIRNSLIKRVLTLNDGMPAVRSVKEHSIESRTKGSRRFFAGIVALTLVLILVTAVPVYSQTVSVRILVGVSPNCERGDPNCEVTETSASFSGLSSISYTFFGVGYTTLLHSTTTTILPTATNASSGEVSGHTTYTITAEGSLYYLRTTANTTAGPIQYGCVFVVPNGVSGEIGAVGYYTFLLKDGTSLRVSTC